MIVYLELYFKGDFCQSMKDNFLPIFGFYLRQIKFIRYIRLFAISTISWLIFTIEIWVVHPVIAKAPEWIERSNEYVELLSQAIAAKACQSQFALTQSLLEVEPKFKQCRQTEINTVLEKLERQQTDVNNDSLRLDLSILLKIGRQQLRSYELNDKYRLPYVNLSQVILADLKATAKNFESSNQKQQEILKKLKQYTGINPGITPLAVALEKAIYDQLQKPDTIIPNPQRLKGELNKNATQINKIQVFLKQQKILGYKPIYEKLKSQLFDYETFIRRAVLTKPKANFHLPIELYALKLQQQGIDIPIDSLIQQAHNAFTQVQQEMEIIALQIAQKQKLKSANYRDVIKTLKQEQLAAEETLSLYQNRAKSLEEIIQSNRLVSIPSEPFNIRLATPQENKNFPVPLYDDENQTFVIPVLQNRQKAKVYNDFTNRAMSWTLTAHEGRPGHDLQITTIKNQNLSRVRTDYAFNSTIVEGWATYAESIMQPYMPLEGRFMSLQFQLLRAARAFLEPELQLGKITKADALKILIQDTGFSPFFAEQEIKRYTETFVGQAPTYFYGYQQLLELRSQVENSQGKQFKPQKFHDFILSQGYLSAQQLSKLLVDNS